MQRKRRAEKIDGFRVRRFDVGALRPPARVLGKKIDGPAGILAVVGLISVDATAFAAFVGRTNGDPAVGDGDRRAELVSIIRVRCFDVQQVSSDTCVLERRAIASAGRSTVLLICSTALAACGGRSRDTIVVEVPGPEAGAAGSAGVPGASGGTGGAQRDAALDDAAIDGAAIIDDAAIDSGSAGCSSSGVADRTLELITVAGGCRAAHGDAASPSLSADGRMVFFQSAADDLVSGDVNGADDVFAFDRVSRKLERISVSATGATADSFSFEPTASDDGRHVVFTSMATNLIAGAPEGIRVYVRDRSARTTALLPATYACAYAPQVSSDGNLVVWEVTPNCRGSGPGDVLGAFLFDRAANHAEPVGQRDGSDN